MYVDVDRLKYEIKKANLTIDELCNITKIPKSTLYRRFRNPAEFTYKEMMSISTAIGYQNPNHLFFTSEVS